MAQKSVGNYELQHKLGRFSVTSSISPQAKDSSGSSRVRHAVNKLTNEPFCVKYFDKQVLRSHGHSDSFKRDMFLLKSLCGQNPYVSDVLDVFANTSKFFVVMNLAEGGHLCDLSLPFSEPKARYYTRQLIDGVQFLHSHSLFLGDINSEVRFAFAVLMKSNHFVLFFPILFCRIYSWTLNGISKSELPRYMAQSAEFSLVNNNNNKQIPKQCAER